MYENFIKIVNNKGLTPYKVSKGTGISGATLTSWKNGSYTPKLDKLKAIADKLHTTPAYLMGWIDNSESQKKNDAITDIILRLRSDEAFLNMVETLSKLPPEQLTAVDSLLRAFKQ